MPETPSPAGGSRPSVGVHLKCCHVYIRAHLNAARNAYVGWCPRCAAQVRIEIVSDGGSRARFFEAQ